MKRNWLIVMFVLLLVGCEYKLSSTDIVNSHGDITNLAIFERFVENVNQGFEDEIRIVTYTIEGDPLLHELQFDGEELLSTIDTRHDEFGSGNVDTTTCKFIVAKENNDQIDYELRGCEETNRMNTVLTIRN